MIRRKRTIAMVALVTLLTTSPVFAQQTDDAERPTVGNNMDRRAGKILEQRSDYTEAERLYTIALNRKTRALGPDNREVAVTLNHLAMLHQQQEHYTEAETYHLRALDIRVKTLGLDHAEVAETLENMMALYTAQGEDAKADGLQARAQGIWDAKDDPDQPEVAGTTDDPTTTPTPPAPAPTTPAVEYAANSWDGITVALMERQAVKDYVRSVELAEDALDAAEAEFGPDHANTARALNNLGFIYKGRGRYAEAKKLYDRAIAIWEKVPEPDHADIALTLDNLARLYSVIGLRGRVNELNERTMAEREMTPDSDRPDLLKLAVIDEHTRVLGEEQSEPFDFEMRSTIAGMKSFDDPYTAQKMHQLAWTRYQFRGQFAYAEQINKMALEARRKLPDQPNVVVGESLVQLAKVYAARGEFERPERLFKEGLEIYEATLGPRDNKYGLINNALASLQDLYDTHAQRAHHFEIDRKIWEVNNARSPQPPVREDVLENIAEGERLRAQVWPDAITNLTDKARLTASNGNYAFALPLYKGALALMDDEHPLYAQTLTEIADLRVAQGENHLAEPLYELARIAAPNARVVDTSPKASPDAIALADSILAGTYPAHAQSPRPPTRSAASIKANPERWQAFEPIIRRHIEAREFVEAGAAARAAIAYAETAFGPYHSNVAISLNLLAEAYILEGRFGATLYLRALEILESVPEPDSRALETTVNALIKHYADVRMTPQVNEIKEREQLLRARIASNAPPKKPKSTAPDQSTILSRPVPGEEQAIAAEWSELTRAFSSLYEAKDYPRAEAVAQQGLQVIERSLLPEFPNLNMSLGQLALAYTAQDKHALAEPHLERSLAMLRNVHEPFHRSVLAAIDALATTYEAQGKEKQARAVRDRFTEEGVAESLADAGRMTQNKATVQEWARAVNEAPILTKSQRGALFQNVLVDTMPAVAIDLDIPPRYQIEADIRRNLEAKGIGTGGADTILFVYYSVQQNMVTNFDRPIGDVFGIAVEARLSRRGFVFDGDNIHPVVAVIARSIATGATTEMSKIDLMSYVTSAVNGLFTANSEPQMDALDGSILVNGSTEQALNSSRLAFLEAELVHTQAEISGFSYLVDMNSIEADNPMFGFPRWAPPYANVPGNPFAEGLAYRLNAVSLPNFTTWLPLVSSHSDWPKETWRRALPPSGGGGDEAVLNYSMSRSNAQPIDPTIYFAVFGNTKITHPNVLIQIGPNRFARTPAHIFTRTDVRFVSHKDGLSGEDGMYAKIENFVKQDADDAAARMTGPWLWRAELEPEPKPEGEDSEE